MAAHSQPDDTGLDASRDFDRIPAAINRMFPLKGSPRIFALYDIAPYDGASPQPARDELIGLGLEFADRAITLIPAGDDGPMCLGVHAQAHDAAALLSAVRPVRVRYL